MSRVKKRRWVVVLVVVLVVLVVDRTRRYRLTTVQAKLHVDVAGMVQTALERSRSGNFVSRVYREATGGRVETRVRLRIAYSRPAFSTRAGRGSWPCRSASSARRSRRRSSRRSTRRSS